MRRGFKIDLRDWLTQTRRKVNNRLDGVEINLPGFTFCIKPTDPEKKAAREIVIFLGDRRVLTSKECCDNCIDNSLDSLQEIRKFVVQKQLDLGALEFGTDGPLFLMAEFTLEAIRQFLTYHERLEAEAATLPSGPNDSDFRRPNEIREQYFEALELLRGHLHGCIHQINVIADVTLPKVPENLKDGWRMESYLIPIDS